MPVSTRHLRSRRYVCQFVKGTALNQSVEIAGVCIDLTEKEFDILALLIMNQRQVYTYEMIMDSVWHDDFSFYSRNAISSHISNLRKKLKSSETASEHIKSIRGIGYKFEV